MREIVLTVLHNGIQDGPKLEGRYPKWRLPRHPSQIPGLPHCDGIGRRSFFCSGFAGFQRHAEQSANQFAAWIFAVEQSPGIIALAVYQKEYFRVRRDQFYIYAAVSAERNIEGFSSGGFLAAGEVFLFAVDFQFRVAGVFKNQS